MSSRRFLSIVFRLTFGKDCFAKHETYSKLDLLHHLFEIWFAGFCVRRIGKIVQSKLPGGIIAIQPFERDIAVITREIFVEQVYDRFYRLQNDDIVVDIGAHVGLFTLKVAKSVKLVVAVEPHPFNYRLLTMNIAFNKLENVIPVKLALSNYSGKDKLYLRSTATHTLRSDMWTRTCETLKVKVETLDRLIDELRLNKVTFIKIDVEGAELDVLKGSQRVLTENDRLFLAIAAYHYPEEVLEVVKYLRTRGFKVLTNGEYVYAFKPPDNPRVLLKL
ncbi:MAG: FkbM family methyltransferase [Desulfurococcaceae archaeon]